MSSRFRSLVLCYHAISDAWVHPLAVGPVAFERQMASLIRRRLRPGTIEEVLSGRRGVLHVTFDDAYTSVRRALPVLERLGIPASIFVCARFADDGLSLDVPELATAAREQPDELRTMRWDELRDLAGRGIEIGSHTLSHAHLTRLSDAELDDELTAAKAKIEEALGRPCRLLAYPYGEEDARVHAAVRRAGYEAAFALPGRSRPVNPLALPRIGVYRSDSLLRMTLKTALLRQAGAQVVSALRSTKSVPS